MSIAEKLSTIAENEQKVYEAGEKAEYDRFWDSMQGNGTRVNYNDAFKCWLNETISPKHTITANQLYQLVQGCTNLVSFDWSKVVPPSAGYVSCYAIANGDSELTSVDTDLIFSTQAGSAAGTFMFNGCKKLTRVQKIYGTSRVQYTSAFQNCNSLVDIVFDGVIANSINFQWSPLSVESMKSVISCLENLKGTANEFTCEIKFNDACWAALEASGVSPSGGTWAEYVDSLGWTT